MDKDTVYRQQAIDAFYPIRCKLQMMDDTQTADKMLHGLWLAEKAIEQLPSAPERKTGKWIDGKRMKFDGTFYWFRQCDQCGYERNDCDTEKDSNFCPSCGAKMEGEEDD